MDKDNKNYPPDSIDRSTPHSIGFNVSLIPLLKHSAVSIIQLLLLLASIFFTDIIAQHYLITISQIKFI